MADRVLRSLLVAVGHRVLAVALGPHVATLEDGAGHGVDGGSAEFAIVGRLAIHVRIVLPTGGRRRPHDAHLPAGVALAWFDEVPDRDVPIATQEFEPLVGRGE